MDKARNVISSLADCLNFVGIAGLVFLMLVTVANVIVRLFGSTIIGAYELSGLMLVLAASSAIVYRALKAGHLMVDILLTKLPVGLQRIVRILTTIISFIATGFLTAATIRWIIEEGLAEKSEVLGLPVLPFKCVWAFGLILLSTVLLLDAINACKESKK